MGCQEQGEEVESKGSAGDGASWYKWKVIVGISDDSTMMVWSMEGALLKQFYHHRASVYGLVVTTLFAVTGSMDGIMSIIDLERLEIMKSWQAEENNWGISDLAGDEDRIVSASFSGQLKVWCLPDCEQVLHLRGHAACYVSMSWPYVGTVSRTAPPGSCLEVWDISIGARIASMGDRPATFVGIDTDKIVVVETVRTESVLRPDISRMTITTAEAVIRPMASIFRNIEEAESEERRIVFSYHKEGGMAVTSTALVYSGVKGVCYFLSLL